MFLADEVVPRDELARKDSQAWRVALGRVTKAYGTPEVFAATEALVANLKDISTRWDLASVRAGRDAASRTLAAIRGNVTKFHAALEDARRALAAFEAETGRPASPLPPAPPPLRPRTRQRGRFAKAMPGALLVATGAIAPTPAATATRPLPAPTARWARPGPPAAIPWLAIGVLGVGLGLAVWFTRVENEIHHA